MPGFIAIQRFLKPTVDIASWYPDPHDYTHHMRVLKHPKASGQFLAVSRESGGHEDIVLSRGDLTVYQLDIASLGRAIAAALGLSAAKMATPLSPTVVRLGALRSHKINIYLVLAATREEFSTAVTLIEAKDKGPIAVITPTERFIPNGLKARIDEGLLQHATLRQLLEVDKDGIFNLLWPLSEYFTEAPGVQGGPPFRTWPLERPSNPSWSDVEVVFLDDENAWIRFGIASRAFHYTDIVGFMKGASGRNYNQSWAILKGLAERRGIANVPTDAADQVRVRKAREELRLVLQSLFGIPASPFGENRREKIWAAHFSVRMK